MKRADAADSDRRAAMALADQTVAMLTDAQARADRARAAKQEAIETAKELWWAKRRPGRQGAAYAASWRRGGSCRLNKPRRGRSVE